MGLRRLDRQPRPDDDDPARPDAVPALRLRGGALARAKPAPARRPACFRPSSTSSPAFRSPRPSRFSPGHLDKINRELIYVDVWENTLRRIKIAPLLGKVDCPCCQRRRFEWLEGDQGSQTTSLCGRNAVQVAQRTPAKLNFEEMAKHLEALGAVSYNRFLLKFNADGHEFTVFPDGRAIIKGTSDIDKARTLCTRSILGIEEVLKLAVYTAPATRRPIRR